MQKDDPDFRVKTFSEWLEFKIRTYVDQSDNSEKAKLEAIFKHFGFLSGNVPDVKNEKPLTPKEIGYLSPRVQRAWYLERPVVVKDTNVSAEEAGEAAKEVKKYETREVGLENGDRVDVGCGFSG